MRVATWIRAAVVLAAAGMTLLTGLAMRLTWTPAGAPSPQGVQGRYFLPLDPLALLALPPLPFAGPRSRPVALLTAGACLLGAAATLWTCATGDRPTGGANVFSNNTAAAELLGAQKDPALA